MDYLERFKEKLVDALKNEQYLKCDTWDLQFRPNWLPQFLEKKYDKIFEETFNNFINDNNAN